MERLVSRARVLGTKLGIRAKCILQHLRRGDVRSAYGHLWARIFVNNVGGGFFHGIYRKFPRLAPYPKQIEVEVTTKCHLKCVICERTYWEEPSRDLSLDEFKHIIGQFPGLKWINATGEGSSFLNKNYLDMLGHLKSEGVSVKLVESFDLIDEPVYEQLIEQGVDRIVVSMDGATKETYESIKVGANFERVLEHLKAFAKMKREKKSCLPELSVRYILQKENVHEVVPFVELIHSLNLDVTTIQFAGLLDFAQIKEREQKSVPCEIVEEANRKAGEFGIRLSWSHTGQLPPITKCEDWLQPYIMMGGYVLPCCQVLMSNRRPYLREHSLGNIFETPFEEIWNSARYVQFRKTVNRETGKLPELCRGCRGYDTLGRK